MPIETTRIIAFVTYETPQFPCGGIAAVMSRLPLAMQEVSASHSIVIAPRHTSDVGENTIRTATLTKAGEGTCTYRERKIPCSAWRLDGGVPTYFVAVDGMPKGEEPVFAGRRHPYDVESRTLLRDALLFGVAVTALLPKIGADAVSVLRARADASISIDWRLVMQDWEAATVALAVAQSAVSAALHVVLHNSYDYFAPPTDEPDEDGGIRPGLDRVGIRATPPYSQTILNRALRLVRDPPFTVSAQFAHELTTDLLQTTVMAPHLQRDLASHPVLGVDNGPFTKLDVPPAAVDAASRGDLTPLRQWKTSNRLEALEALAKHQPTQRKPIWGDREKFRHRGRDWVVMAGRDDPRQKGYDVAALAVDWYLERHAGREQCPQFVFFPIPGDEDLDGLRFLEDLARRRDDSVLVLPFRWAEGYLATLRASCFGLMPSLYEPFGMANEFYLAGGCPGIGRATGGNVEQIVPLWASHSCNGAVRARSVRFHSLSSAPTGLLFREPDDLPSRAEDWRAINAAKYIVGSVTGGRLEERSAYGVFSAMAAELLWAIDEGMRIWHEEPALYGRMLAAGVNHITAAFSWSRAAQEYARYVDRAR